MSACSSSRATGLTSRSTKSATTSTIAASSGSRSYTCYAARWSLRALVWPEEIERAELLERALAVARREAPRLLAGDALELLPNSLTSLPGAAVACVFHTHTVNQFKPRQRAQLSTLLAAHGADRELYRISIEGFGHERPLLELFTYSSGLESVRPLAWCDAHGSWIEWTAG